MRSTFFILSLLTLVVEAYYIFPNPPARRIENGDLLTENTYAVVPRRKALQFKIAPSEGQVLVDFNAEAGHPLQCHRVIVTDDSNGEKINFCEHKSFNSSSSVTVQIEKLSHNMEVVVKVVKNNYSCNQMVDRMLIGINFQLNTPMAECQFLLPRGDLFLKADPNARDSNGKCLREVEVRQGRHIARLSMSTGRKCLDEALTIPLFCGTHGLIVFGSDSSPIEAIVKAPSKGHNVFEKAECPL